jgi:diamine N-acetyltransferase
MQVVIRDWVDTDIPSVQHIAWTTWLATYGSFIPERDMQAFFDEYYTAQALMQFCGGDLARGFIAHAGETAAAFAKTMLNPSDQKFYLNSLYALPEHQGKGIGSMLLRRCQDFARTLGASEIWLGVMTKNTAALDWYRNIGFQFVHEEPFTMGQTTVQHLIGYRTIRPLTTTE